MRKLTAGKKTRIESRADWPVPGVIVHAAGQGAHGFRVVDVWEQGSRHSRIFDRPSLAKLWDIAGSGFLGDESDAAGLVPIRT